jgi:hypothetical protein
VVVVVMGGHMGGWKRYGVGGGVAHDKVVEGENVLLVGGVLVGRLVVDVGEEDFSVHVLVECERVCKEEEKKEKKKKVSEGYIVSGSVRRREEKKRTFIASTRAYRANNPQRKAGSAPNPGRRSSRRFHQASR